MIELSKEYIENLKGLIEAKEDAKIQPILQDLYPADIAELYQELSLQEAIYLYLLMDGEKAADDGWREGGRCIDGTRRGRSTQAVERASE